MTTGWYGWMMFAGILVTAVIWARAARRDRRLPFIYAMALVGAFAGAKLLYLVAEGWNDIGHPDLWTRWATGKSILGSLLLGYAAVEGAKRWVGYTSPTGDTFAVITPLGVALGRIGCWLHGCCLGHACPAAWYTVPDRSGVARWPAVPLEFAFNALAFAAGLFLSRRRCLSGQLFHVYLMAYGLFRFAHEFARDTPRVLGPFSGYHVAAVAVMALGAVRYSRRQTAALRQGATTESGPPRATVRRTGSGRA